MRTGRVVMTAAAAIIGVGLLAGTAVAATGAVPGPGGVGATATCPTGAPGSQAGRGTMAAGAGQGYGTQAGNGRTGTGRPAQAGTGAAAAGYASGTLTSTQKDELAFMIEEEKLAHDVYTTLAATYDVPVLSRIASAETQHMTVLQTMATTYGVTDPSSSTVGVFTDDKLAAMYTDLVAQGKTSLTDAYAVGQAIEKDDIARIAQASDGLAAPDLQHSYERLTTASEQHLAAFGG